MKQNNQIQPYEKFRLYGPENLTDQELLAIILRTGTRNCNAMELADKVLKECYCGKQGLLGLFRISIEQLSTIKGIGPVKAIKLKCITELSRRISQTIAWDGKMFQRSSTVAAYLMESMRHLDREQIQLLMFDSKGHLIKEMQLTSGTANMSLLSPRDVFIELLKAGAVQFIIAHNHPSGDPTPSNEDKRITDNLYELGIKLELMLIDHIIIGDNIYFSFKEQGLL